MYHQKFGSNVVTATAHISFSTLCLNRYLEFSAVNAGIPVSHKFTQVVFFVCNFGTYICYVVSKS